MGGLKKKGPKHKKRKHKEHIYNKGKNSRPLSEEECKKIMTGQDE